MRKRFIYIILITLTVTALAIFYPQQRPKHNTDLNLSQTQPIASPQTDIATAEANTLNSHSAATLKSTSNKQLRANTTPLST
jgi:hypothetical protein